MTYRTHYAARDRGYYDFDALFILMVFLQLSRIESFEQTKQPNPGEWGKMIGFDRIPEVKKLRGSVHEITDRKQCDSWSADLSSQWIGSQTPEIYYVEGHVQVYHGALAMLGKKHVSRQRLSLPCMPFFFVTTNKILPPALIAAYMFDRSGFRRIFFRYMRQEYSLDKIIQYGVEQIDDDFKVIPRQGRK